MAAGTLPELTNEPEHVFQLADLLPYLDRYGNTYGIDPRVVAGVAYQESGLRNWRVHADGTGAGLFGLDDGGLLPDFERWSGLVIGRGRQHAMIPPARQIEYASMQLAAYARQYGDAWTACAVWHRGEGLYRDQRGTDYIGLIRAHVQRLFP